jgi:glucose/arabinose dehydrogenase
MFVTRPLWIASALTAALAACGGDSSTEGLGGGPRKSVSLQRAFPNFTFDAPVGMVQVPGDGARWFVAERLGTVRSFEAADETTASSTVAIGIEVDASGEGGLLGFALHPDFANNGQAFLSYTVTGPDSGTPLVSRISRVTSADGGQTFDPATEEILLTLDQPFINHNGGHILFGPDGLLYVGFGDGGSGGDPLDNGQDTSDLFGALLRIDLNSGQPYGIPPDNPFTQGGGRPEIYAYGLRNPWRFSFDRADGTLWLGDVGQGEREEVDIVAKGGNYGWRCYEGSLEFNLEGCGARSQYIFPVSEYSHDEGRAITGGFVYRGSAIPELWGVYVFGDFISGTIWGLFPDGAGGFQRRLLVDSELGVVSFAEGADGELYVLDLFGGGIHRLVAK